MNEKLDMEDIEYDYIMYVPLHRKRLRERGFNQSEKIAYYLSEIENKEMLNGINRIKNTNNLYKLNRRNRHDEIKKAFNIDDKYKDIIRGKNILLVDDIFTTGTTVNEISRILKHNQVNKVFVISLLTKIDKTY